MTLDTEVSQSAEKRAWTEFCLTPPGRERIIPNPKLKLLDQVRKIPRLKQ
jgi:hypothetical protein